MLGAVGDLFGSAFREWRDDDAMQWSAALAYYAALAVAPLLVLLLAVVGAVWQGPDAQQRVVEVIQRQAGEQPAELARMILRQDEEGDSGLLAGVVSTLLLLVGASGVFSQLQKALNAMWDVEPEEGGLRHLLKGRVLGFGLVLGLGVLLLAALVVQTALSAVAGGGGLRVLNQAGSVVVFTIVFGALFHVLPDVRIGWREVWLGAAATALLFTAGQLLVGLYLGRGSVGSRYGAAGTLVAFLVWLYYSGMVFFFGAELTQVGARRWGRAIEPEAGARRVREVAVPRAESGDGTDGKPEGPRPPADRTDVRGEASFP